MAIVRNNKDCTQTGQSLFDRNKQNIIIDRYLFVDGSFETDRLRCGPTAFIAIDIFNLNFATDLRL